MRQLLMHFPIKLMLQIKKTDNIDYQLQFVMLWYASMTKHKAKDLLPKAGQGQGTARPRSRPRTVKCVPKTPVTANGACCSWCWRQYYCCITQLQFGTPHHWVRV